MAMYMGLDVHCKSTVYVAEDESGKIIAEGNIPTTPEGTAEPY